VRAALPPPGETRPDWWITAELAKRVAARVGVDVGRQFDYAGPAEIFDEMARLTPFLAGLSHVRLDREGGIQWPCPTAEHPGTPRLFEGGKFAHPDGRARFHAIEYRPPAETTDDAYPIILTTGRVVSQFLSGTQTRRIGPLVEQYPEPRVEMHPKLAAKLDVRDGERVRVSSRRGALELTAHVVATIRPDTVFIPYHWPGAQSANLLTHRAYDPVAGIPEFKVAAVRIDKLEISRAAAVH
jgi:assimilatory nitrate reductase catalytic subunit